MHSPKLTIPAPKQVEHEYEQSAITQAAGESFSSGWCSMNNLSMPPQAMNSSRAMVTVGVVHAVGLVDKDDSVVNLRHTVIQLRDYNILHSQPVGKPPPERALLSGILRLFLLPTCSKFHV